MTINYRPKAVSATMRYLLVLIFAAAMFGQLARAEPAPDLAQEPANLAPPEPGQWRSPTAVQWVDGPLQYAATIDCITGVTNGIGTGVSQLIDTATFQQPYVGQRFYLKVTAGALAAPCAGSYLAVYFVPPQGVNVDAVANYPTRCFSKAPSQSAVQEFTNFCPQPPYSILPVQGGSAFLIPNRDPATPTNIQPTWPFPFGAIYEFWIPVISTRQMNGLNSTSGIQAYGPVRYFDGVNTPWLTPLFSMFVAPAPVQADPIFQTGFE